MPRVKVGVTAHRRHKKILKLAKGYKGSKSKQFKKANLDKFGISSLLSKNNCILDGVIWIN